MKKILFLSLIAATLLSCNGKKKEAKAIAEKWVIENIFPFYVSPEMSKDPNDVRHHKYDWVSLQKLQNELESIRLKYLARHDEAFRKGRVNDWSEDRKINDALSISTDEAYNKIHKSRADYYDVSVTWYYTKDGGGKGVETASIILDAETLTVQNSTIVRSVRNVDASTNIEIVSYTTAE